MGLDVHFYNRKKIKPENQINNESLIKETTNLTTNTEILNSLKKLKEYSLLSETPFNECLIKAINQFLDHDYGYYEDRYNEVAYFRKFWWALEFFGYSDSDYGNDKPVTKEQIEDAKNLAEKTIKMVIKHFTDKGFEIEHSPLEYTGKTARWGGDGYYLTFKNGILNDELEEEADDICYSVFDTNADFLFTKVCELYVQFSEILKTTDFDNEVIVMNADW